MSVEPCTHIREREDTPQQACTCCMSFYKGLVNALILSSVAWGIVLWAIYYITR